MASAAAAPPNRFDVVWTGSAHLPVSVARVPMAVLPPDALDLPTPCLYHAFSLTDAASVKNGLRIENAAQMARAIAAASCASGGAPLFVEKHQRQRKATGPESPLEQAAEVADAAATIPFSSDLLLGPAAYEELGAKERAGGLSHRERQQLHVSREAFAWGLQPERFSARFYSAFMCMFDDDAACRDMEEQRNRLVAAAHAVTSTAEQLGARYSAAAASARGVARRQDALDVFRASAERMWLPGMEAVRLLDAAKPGWREEAKRAPAHAFHLTAEEIAAGFAACLRSMDRGAFGRLMALLPRMKMKDHKGRDRFDLVTGAARAAAAAAPSARADGAGTSAEGAGTPATPQAPGNEEPDNLLNSRTAFLRGFLAAALAVEVRSDPGPSKSRPIVGRHRVSFKPLYDAIEAHAPRLLTGIVQPFAFVADE